MRSPALLASPVMAASAADDIPPPPLNILIAYDEAVAYRGAMRLLANALCDYTNVSEVRPLPWRFDEVRLQPWRGRSLANAAGADVFLVATTGTAPIPCAVMEWLEACFAARNGAATAVLALYDRERDFQRFGALCEVLVRAAAETAGLQFIEPARLAAACPR